MSVELIQPLILTFYFLENYLFSLSLEIIGLTVVRRVFFAILDYSFEIHGKSYLIHEPKNSNLNLEANYNRL